MTDLASALATPADPGLTAYRGRPVVRAEAKVTNVGDGLSESLGVGAIELEQGDVVDLLVRCVVGPHTIRVLKGYDDDEKDAPLRIVMTLVGKTVTIVDAEFADERIRQQKILNQQRADSAKGVQRLPGSDEWESEDASVHPFPGNGNTDADTADTDTEAGDTEAAVDAAVAEAEAPEAGAKKPRRRGSAAPKE